MVNADPYWIYLQQSFLNAVEGSEVKDNLINCLNILLKSHNANMADKSRYYADLIWWDPNDPETPSPPPGWHIDADGHWTKDVLTGGEEQNGS